MTKDNAQTPLHKQQQQKEQAAALPTPKKECKDAEPLWTGQDPRQVGIWPRIFRIESVDTSQQVCKVKLVLIVKWLDYDFAKKHAKLETPAGQDNRAFFDTAIGVCPTTPKLRFENLVDDYEPSLEFMWVNPQGVCHWERWGMATLKDPVEARNFPFDYNDFSVDLRLKRDFTLGDRYFCTIRSHTNEYNQNRIHICTYNDSCPEWNVCALDGKPAFYVERDQIHVTPLLCKSNLKSGWDAQFLVYFVVRRQPWYYLLNLWSFTILMNAISLASFAVYPTEVASRQVFLLTIILVQLAIKFAFNDALPKLPYLTTLDWKVYISSLLLALLLTLQSIFGAMMASSNNDDATIESKDKRFFYWWIGVTILDEVLFGLLGWRRIKRQRKKMERRAADLFGPAAYQIQPITMATPPRGLS